jgi:hypothetical protein
MNTDCSVEDVSDIDPAPKVKNSSLKVNFLNLNKEVLEEIIEQIQNKITKQQHKIKDLKTTLTTKVSEKQLGDYFTRIHKQIIIQELGEKS